MGVRGVRPTSTTKRCVTRTGVYRLGTVGGTSSRRVEKRTLCGKKRFYCRDPVGQTVSRTESLGLSGRGRSNVGATLNLSGVSLNTRCVTPTGSTTYTVTKYRLCTFLTFRLGEEKQRKSNKNNYCTRIVCNKILVYYVIE